MAEPDTDKRPEADAATHPSVPPAPGAKPASVPPGPAARPSSGPAVAASRTSSTQILAVPIGPTTAPMIAVATPVAPPDDRGGAPVVHAPPHAMRVTTDRAPHREPAAAFASGGAAAAHPAGAAGGPLAAYEAVARSARLPDLVAITQRILADAASARRPTWSYVEKVGAAADEARLSRNDADTPFGNALKVLGSGPEGEAERALACAMWAHAIAEARHDDLERLAGDVLWLATHTAFDATSLLDRALGEEADDLWGAIGARVRRIDDGRGSALGRGEAILGCAALTASGSVAARRVAGELAPKLHDPTLARLLAGATSTPQRELRLEGVAVSAPRGPVLTTILALTGILFVIHAVRLIGRFAFAYRRPAEVSLSESGIRMKTRTEMLGRTLREHEHVIVRSGLVRVVREVRYPRAAFYTGLLALALGSYIGVRAFADGVRSASPSLLVTGLVVVILGIALDFVFGSLLPGTRGQVRISFVPRTGPALCLSDVDATRADDALAHALSTRS